MNNLINKSWNWLKDEKNNHAFIAIVTFLTLIGAIFIGFWQNQINNELKDIASKELTSSQSPLLSVDFSSFKYNEVTKFFTKEIKFSNKGAVPINVLNYEVSFPQNPQKTEPLKQALDGTLFQGESITSSTVMNSIPLNEVQLVVIKVNFVSLFDPKNEFCVTRTYTFQTKNESLLPLNLSEFYKCDSPPPEFHTFTF